MEQKKKKIYQWFKSQKFISPFLNRSRDPVPKPDSVWLAFHFRNSQCYPIPKETSQRSKLFSRGVFLWMWTIQGVCILLPLYLSTNKCQIFSGSDRLKYILLLVFLNYNHIQKKWITKYNKKSHEHSIANKVISMRKLQIFFSLCFPALSSQEIRTSHLDI